MIRLRMKYAIPFHLEHKLVTKYGFAIEKKTFNDCIVFVKTRKRHQPTVFGSPRTTVRFSPSLTEAFQKDLGKRCDAIVDHFPDPYNAIMAVRQRLHNMCQALPSVAARQYVIDYTEENFPEDYKKKA